MMSACLALGFCLTNVTVSAAQTPTGTLLAEVLAYAKLVAGAPVPQAPAQAPSNPDDVVASTLTGRRMEDQAIPVAVLGRDRG